MFLIGDFTGMIGDPTGKNATRPPLTREEIAANAETYKRRSSRFSTPRRPRSSSTPTWMDQLNSAGHDQARRARTRSRACSSATISPSAIKRNQPIAIHEFLYPLVQGYDSVALKADVELGGTDQKFNLLMGRELQKRLRPGSRRCILTMPLLEGLDGVNKMSKSLGNYIGITEPPERDVRQADVGLRRPDVALLSSCCRSRRSRRQAMEEGNGGPQSARHQSRLRAGDRRALS